MLQTIFHMFSYGFMVRALLVGCLISLCAALLGVSLVLKRYSMIGDGLSHVGFGALAVASVMNWAPLAVAIPVVILSAFLLMRISQNARIKGDALIGLISSGALAIGVMAVSLTSGMNVDINNYMFGSILSLSRSDTVMSLILSACVLLCYILLYPRIFAVTFDDVFAQATGTKTGIYNTLLAVLTAVTIVLGMRMMGALLISSLVIFPALTSMRVCSQFKQVIICAAVLSLLCFLAGISISYLYGTPTGASVVCVNMAAFVVAAAVGEVRSRSRRGQMHSGRTDKAEMIKNGNS